MYFLYGLPLCAAIAMVAAIVIPLIRNEGRAIESRRTIRTFAIFLKVFRTTALAGAALVVVACIWAQFAIGPR